MIIQSILTKISRIPGGILRPTRIGVDMGTAMTRIAIEDKGVVLREPTFTGVNTKNGQYLFFGTSAKEIYGKSPGFVKVVKPIEHSIISDFDSTVALIEEFMRKAVQPFFAHQLIRQGSDIYTTVPTTSTEVEQKALQEAMIKAGARNAYIMERPIAAASGAGLPIFTNKPQFIVDCGAGTIEAALITMGGVVSSKVMKLGGDHLDRLVYNYLHLKYGLIIGEQTAENLKNTLYNLVDKKDVLPIRGKSLENGLPKSVRVTSSDIQEALSPALIQIADGLKELIETAPPEMIDGIIRSGAVLSGQLAVIPGLDKYLTNEIKIPFTLAQKPDDATINGIMRIIKHEDLRKIVLNSK